MAIKQYILSIFFLLALGSMLQACSSGGSGTPDSDDLPELGAAVAGSDDQNIDAGDSGNNISDVADSNDASSSSSINDVEFEQQQFFESAAVSGFNAQLLDDGNVQLEWPAHQGARGYNVYRAGEYHATVMDSSYLDVQIGPGSYYYEIIAFDNNDTFELIADALTVYIDTPTAAAATAAGTLPNHIQSDYELVFAEEFETESLDFSRWNTSYLWGTDLVINSEEQYYVDTKNRPDFGYDPFKLNGSTLTIEAIRTPDHLLDQANGQPYLSGVITSYDSFQFTYGYVEARAKVPFGQGLWSAFWLLNAYYVDLKPEIDIVEHIGNERDVVYHTYHYYDANGELRSTESLQTRGIDFTSEFHTYAVEWRPGKIIFYVDGIERHTVSDPNVSAQSMYIIANTALGGWWPGSPDDSTVFPSQFEIDYIRAYQKTGVQYDAPLFNDAQQTVPLAKETFFSSPNHLPSPEQWPAGYPELEPVAQPLNDTQTDSDSTDRDQTTLPNSPNHIPSPEQWPQGYPELSPPETSG